MLQILCQVVMSRGYGLDCTATPFAAVVPNVEPTTADGNDGPSKVLISDVTATADSISDLEHAHSSLGYVLLVGRAGHGT
jgi:hypothetical protein